MSQLVVPRLQQVGWDNEPHSIAEQRTITDGRIVPVGKGFVRRPPKRADYLLRYRRDFPLAVVEAKAGYKTAAAGLQQAKEYAEMLGLKFAYATNGHEIVEFDYFTGLEKTLTAFPTPDELWPRYERLAAFRIRQPTDCSRLATTPSAKASATTRRSPSTARSRRSCRASPPAAHDGDRHGQDRGRLSDLLEAVEAAGIAPASIAARGSSTSPTATSSSTSRRTASSRRSATRAARSSRRSGEQGREMYFAIYQALARGRTPPRALSRNSRPTSSTSSSWTSATAAARATTVQLARDPRTTSSPPISSA